MKKMTELCEKVIGHLITNKTIKTNSDYVITCPLGVHSDSTPSFSVSHNPDKPVYHCFSCNAKGSLIGLYMILNNRTYSDALKDLSLNNPKHNYIPKVHPEKEKEYTNYSGAILNAYLNFIDNYEKYGKKLYELTGITFSTANKCMIGVNEKGWIFPIYNYKTKQYIGYEIRKHDFTKFDKGNKCYKSKDPCSCLSLTYEPIWDSNNKAIVCEGFKDSCYMYQYLSEKGKNEDVKYTIFTPSCGVSTVLEVIEENNYLCNFEEVMFVLDNDNKSLSQTKQLRNLKKTHFKFFRDLKDGQDFEDYYKAINKKEI